MTNADIIEDLYSFEKFGTGFIVADYSGKRGKFGAAYAGSDGEWCSQPVGMLPFISREAALNWIKENHT